MKRQILSLVRAIQSAGSLRQAYRLKPAFLAVIVRCKDERIVPEFCEHYLSEGVDRIIIVDDNSADKSVYDRLDDPRITVIWEKDIIRRSYVSLLYKVVRKKFSWIAYVDADEFITGRGDGSLTIRNALETTFASADCVKVPWVMMSCSRRKDPPKSLRRELVYRWNHDLRHPHPVEKFRCRYDAIEVKSIFRPAVFDHVTDHHPIKPRKKDPVVVDSISARPAALSTTHSNLREADIEKSILACYHYRIISLADVTMKLRNNIWYHEYSIDDLMDFDNAEIYDDTLKAKAESIS